MSHHFARDSKTYAHCGQALLPPISRTILTPTQPCPLSVLCVAYLFVGKMVVPSGCVAGRRTGGRQPRRRRLGAPVTCPFSTYVQNSMMSKRTKLRHQTPTC
jgi:hypothetical protein